MEFAVANDDGHLSDSLAEAQIVLVGASRTGKTPLSMYLGYLGYRTADIPLVVGVPPPPELFAADPWKVVGLTINPERPVARRSPGASTRRPAPPSARSSSTPTRPPNGARPGTGSSWSGGRRRRTTPLDPFTGSPPPCQALVRVVSETDAMVTLIFWLVSALVLLIAVFLVASVMERGQGLPGDTPEGNGIAAFWRSFRGGLRHRGRGARPVDTDLDAILADRVEPGPGYVDAEQLADALTRARQQATRHLHVGTARAPE